MGKGGSCGKRGDRRGTLRKRGGVYHAEFMVNGKRHYLNTRTSDKAEAERILSDEIKPFELNDDEKRIRGYLSEIGHIAEERRDIDRDKRRVAVGDIFAAFCDEMLGRSSAGSGQMADYGSKIARFVGWLGESGLVEVRDMRDIGEDIAERFMGYIGRIVSNNTYNKYALMLSRVWRKLARRAGLVSNPWVNIERKRLETHSRRELTIDELRRVSAAVSGEMRLLFAVGIYTGLRLGDCAMMEWASVDLDRRRIVILPKKTKATGRRVFVPIHSNLYSMLFEIPRDRRVRYVMPELAAMYRMEPQRLVKKIQGVFENCGIGTRSEIVRNGKKVGRARVDVGFHSLRHTFVSLAANGGAPFAVVQAIVGHSTAAMTQHYFHENEISMRRAVDSIPCIDETGACCLSGRGEILRLVELLDSVDDLRAVVDFATARLQEFTALQKPLSN